MFINITSLVALSKVLVLNTDMTRPLCPSCNSNLCAVNYHSNGKIRYRKLCDSCSRKGKKLKQVPAWYKAGYRKKAVCDRCGFRAKFPEPQMSVFHLDGNLKNTNEFNLKSICLNCRIELQLSGSVWRESPIKPDF